MLKLKLPIKLVRFISLTTGGASRFFGRGGGTSLPGKIACLLRPSIAGDLVEKMSLKIVLISGTNGKTTTSNLLKGILTEDGTEVIANSEGANLMSGITTVLLKNSKRAKKGKVVGIFEIDEAVLTTGAESLKPSLIILGNLFRDQLDRYGEIEALIQQWKKLFDNLSPEVQILANGDDPLVVETLELRLTKNVASINFFGLQDIRIGRENPPSIRDSYSCRRCGNDLNYALFSVGHQGWWSCSSCEWKRPKLDFQTTQVDIQNLDGVSLEMSDEDTTTSTVTTLSVTTLSVTTLSGQELSAKLPLPGLHNVYNATAAIGAGFLLGAKSVAIKNALQNASRTFGRFEEILSVFDAKNTTRKKILLILAKNPVSVNENLQALLGMKKLSTSQVVGQKKLHLLVVLNDHIADGQDVSWIWDVDYELIMPKIESLTLSGRRAGDMGLRWLYGGLEDSKLEIQENLKQAYQVALQKAPEELIVLVTYTALLEFRKILEKQKLVKPYWKN